MADIYRIRVDISIFSTENVCTTVPERGPIVEKLCGEAYRHIII